MCFGIWLYIWFLNCTQPNDPTFPQYFVIEDRKSFKDDYLNNFFYNDDRFWKFSYNYGCLNAFLITDFLDNFFIMTLLICSLEWWLFHHFFRMTVVSMFYNCDNCLEMLFWNDGNLDIFLPFFARITAHESEHITTEAIWWCKYNFYLEIF